MLIQSGSRWRMTILISLLKSTLWQIRWGPDSVAALRLFRAIAADNGKRFRAGETAWQGMAFNLVP
jgi:hypothetical protein